MSNNKDKFFNLNIYNNPFEDKIVEMDKKLDEIVRQMAQEDAQKFNVFPGFKFFKIKEK